MSRTWLLAALLVVCPLAAAQSQAPAAATPDTSVQAPVALDAKGAPAVATEPPPPRTKAAAPETPPPVAQWWERSDWLLVVPTWLLALIAIGFTIYTARVWKSTAALVDEVKDTARKELRAYVALDEIFFSEAEDSAAGVHKLRIRNYGQTPASGMSIWCERASHLPQEGVKPFYDAPVIDGQLLHPVQAFTLALVSAPLYRIGKPGFFTYGRIVYHDIYSRWWVTKFCYRYEGDGTFLPHGDYNNEEGPFEKPPA